MGIDLLRISSQTKAEFGIDPRGEKLRDVMLSHTPPDITAGEFHDFICQLCETNGVPIPEDSWQRLVRILADVGAIDNPDTIRRDSWMIHDLGFE